MKDEIGTGTPPSSQFWRTRLKDLSIFLRLGCTSFGGPIAHLGYFRTELVERRGWCSEETYAEIIAVAQSLPGPASSQVCFSLGLLRGGWLGGLSAWVGFTLPSAVLMTCFAFAEQSLRGKTGNAVVHGLQLSAVAVVAQAILVMRKNLTPDWQQVLIALIAGVIALIGPPSFNTLLAIAFGAIGGAVLLRGDSATWLPPLDLRISRRAGTIAALVYLVLLIASAIIPPAIPRAIPKTSPGVLEVGRAFYLSGALVFGGGHVVLPLLEHAVVSPGWVTQPSFLSGYGFAQAMPGPLFTFAAFLGAAIQSGSSRVALAFDALIAIFLPGLLAMVAALSFWSRIRHSRSLQTVIPGINASVLGVLAAAFLRPVCSTAVHSALDLLVAAMALVLLTVRRVRPWMVVLGAVLVSVLASNLF
jgi:chromate transporter